MRHALAALAAVAAIAAIVLSASPLWADPPPQLPGRTPGKPMSPAEFATYATGRTLSYAADGTVWGKEQYLPDRQVMWAFTGKDCQFGQWYPQGNAVCFVYEGDAEPKCWNFYMGPRGLIAALIGSDDFTPLSEVGQSSQPLDCQGPQVGA